MTIAQHLLIIQQMVHPRLGLNFGNCFNELKFVGREFSDMAELEAASSFGVLDICCSGFPTQLGNESRCFSVIFSQGAPTLLAHMLS